MQRSGLGRFGERVASAWTGTPAELAKIAAADAVDRNGTLKAVDKRALRAGTAAMQARTTRRRLIGIGGPLLLGGLVIASIEIPPLIGELNKSDEERLGEHITRLGIKESPAEKALWASAGFEPYPLADLRRQLAPAEVAALSAEAINRMNRVIALMPDSESRLVASAGEHLRASLYRPDGQSVVTFQLRDGSPARAGENPNLSMGIGLGAPSGETVNLLIMPTIQRVLTDTPQGLSNQLVHEDKHMEQFQRTLDTVKQEKLPVQIKQALLAQDLRMYWNEKEAEAYGTQFLAYIDSYGLTGESIRWADRHTLALIDRGSDISSREWLKYVSRNLVSRIQ